MKDSYERMLNIQEGCNSLATFAKTINGEIKKFEMKDEIHSIPRIRTVMNSLYRVVEDLDKEIMAIETGEEVTE